MTSPFVDQSVHFEKSHHVSVYAVMTPFLGHTLAPTFPQALANLKPRLPEGGATNKWGRIAYAVINAYPVYFRNICACFYCKCLAFRSDTNGDVSGAIALDTASSEH